MKESNDKDQTIIDSCKELLSRSWAVEIRHILREANKVADWIVKWATKLGVEEFELSLQLQDLIAIQEEDAQGVKLSKVRSGAVV